MSEPFMKVRVTLNLSAKEVEDMVATAISHGFLREDPKIAWHERERKEAIRYYIYRLLGHI